MYLLLYKMKFDIKKVTLKAGSQNVINKFYVPKGFRCNSACCKGDIIKLIGKCNIPDIKLILVHRDVYIDNLETMISFINPEKSS